MNISKEEKSINMARENEYGYSHAVEVGDTIYLSEQVSNDDIGNVLELPTGPGNLPNSTPNRVSKTKNSLSLGT